MADRRLIGSELISEQLVRSASTSSEMSCAEPLLGAEEARPSMLGSDALSVRQQRIDERVRTLCLVIISTAIIMVTVYDDC